MKHLVKLVVLASSLAMAACSTEGTESTVGGVDESEWPAAATATSGLCTSDPDPKLTYVGDPRDVTDQFKVDDKRTIRKITDVGAPGAAMLTYYDVTSYLPTPNRLVYNVHKNTKGVPYNYFVTSDLRGKDIKTIASWSYPTAPTSFGFVSDDGKLLVYMGYSDTAGHYKVYGVWLDENKTCAPFPISKGDYACTAGVSSKDKVIPCMEHPSLSPPVFDPIRNKYVVAYAVGTGLYVVTADPKYPDDATAAPNAAFPNVSSDDGRIALDPVVGSGSDDSKLGFHRVRLNPAFPNLLMYRRAAPPDFASTANLYVVDLNDPSFHLPAFLGSGGFHPVWRPDGLYIGINKGELVDRTVNDQETQVRVFTEYRVAEVTGGVATLVSDMAQYEPKPYFNAPENVFYATYSRNPSNPAVAFATTLDDRSQVDGDNRAGKIYVMKAVSTATPKAVTYTNFFDENDEEDGQPRMSFFNGNAGLVFSTDNGHISGGKRAEPQVYTVTNLSLSN